MSRIGIDIDGTIRDIYTPLIECFKKKYPNGEVKSIKKWNDYKIWKHFKNDDKIIDEDVFKKFWFDGSYTNEIYRDYSLLYENVLKGLYLLKKDGHKIILISAQSNDNTKALTMEWLGDTVLYQDLVDEIHFTEYETKGNVLCDIYIEDSPKQLEFLLDSSNYLRYSDLYVMDRPWNQNAIGTRVKDMVNFYNSATTRCYYHLIKEK